LDEKERPIEQCISHGFGGRKIFVDNRSAMVSKSIVEVVEQDSDLQAVVQQLLDRKFLCPGVFHPNAYLIDRDRIEAMWNGANKGLDKHGKLAAIAVGVAIYNDFFREVFARVMSQEEPQAEPETSEWLEEWQQYVAESFPDDESIEEVAGMIGQYMEFMNRKSQGF
jgi:transcription elongation factor Elf1